MRTCVLFLVCPLPRVLCFLPRLTVLLPALPDVHLSAQREVQVQPPVRLPLGDRGHIRLRDTPHINEIVWSAKAREGPAKAVDLVGLCERLRVSLMDSGSAVWLLKTSQETLH